MGDCLATTDMGQKLRGCAPFGGSWVSIWAKAYLRTEWHLDPSSHLATIDKGQKLGAVPLLGGAGSPSNTKSPGWRPTSVASGILIHPAIWLQQTWAKNWGGALRERAGSPPNTMSSGPRSTFVPSGILMHPAIWPQETWAENLAGAVLHLLGGGAGSPGPRPTSIPSGILIPPAVWPQRTWAKNWGAVPLLGGSWVPI